MTDMNIEVLLNGVQVDLDAVKDKLDECLSLLKMLYDEVNL